ncbi:hypothetical protein ACQKWADRAFT_293636 [Trichoderma austrokoningii]
MAPAPGQALSGTQTVDVIDTDTFPSSADGPLAEGLRVFARLAKRTNDPSKGVLDPHDINNAGFFFLFALIGVAFVITGIWFFFWAKNGGIYFKDDDWDDYKSTVMRRKGPNGTILSNATRSTNLGGGSVYKRYDDDHHADDGHTVITESTALSGITAGASDIFAREKRKKKKEARDAERRKRRGEKGKSASSNEFEGVVDEKAERDAKKFLRNYRHEKSARVGGINKEAEGSEWEGSTNAAESSVGATSELLLNQEPTPTSDPDPPKAEPSRTEPSRTEPPKIRSGGGIRKVYSTADRRENRESERLRAEARRLRAADKVAQRDFAYQRATGMATDSQLSESLLSGTASGSGGGSTTLGESIPEEGESEVGTKSYHHPLPELREQRRREREERRARRTKSGYRRTNTDENSDI